MRSPDIVLAPEEVRKALFKGHVSLYPPPHPLSDPDTRGRILGCQNLTLAIAAKNQHIRDALVVLPIKTAYYLAQAARRDVFPEHQQTLEDYGFNKAFSFPAQQKLFGLFQGLLVHLRVKPSVLDKWKTNGTLIQEIKAAYEDIPVQSRGGYYPWFLQNQWVLDNSLPRPKAPVEVIEGAMKQAWALIGGSLRDSVSQIKEKQRQWSEDRKSCFYLYHVLLLNNHPSPFETPWIDFGFCACMGAHQESMLAFVYKDLFSSCTFDEIVTAYTSSKLIALMDSKGFRNRREKIIELADALGKYRHKSVWDLKQFVMVESGEMTPSVGVDYGFMNCQNEGEFTTLRELYKTILGMPRVKAVDLHHAAIQGELFTFISRFVQLEKKPKRYRRLLKKPISLGGVQLNHEM